MQLGELLVRGITEDNRWLLQDSSKRQGITRCDKRGLASLDLGA